MVSGFGFRVLLLELRLGFRETSEGGAETCSLSPVDPSGGKGGGGGMFLQHQTLRFKVLDSHRYICLIRV